VARISLCLIARNEERFLPGCLASVRGVVDEIVLVDTGSTDRTRELARAAGATVLDRPWDDDFAAPRNLAAAHARGAWILQLDADERLAQGGGRAVRRALAGARFDVGLVRCHNADAPEAPEREVLSGARRVGAPGLIPRLLRRTPDLRWEGCIHESVLEWAGRRGNRIVPVEVDLVHLGYCADVWSARDKRARNLALLHRRAAREPGNPVALGYLAAELLSDGQVDEAARVAEEGWAGVPREPAHRSIRRLAVVRGAAAVRRSRPAEALESAALAEAREGPNPDLAFVRGCAHELLASAAAGPERAAALGEAERAYREALPLLDRSGVEQVMYASRAGALLRLGAVVLAAGRPAEAQEAFLAARAAGADGRATLGVAEALLALGRPGEALREVEPILAQGPDGWALAARAAEALGAAADARAFRAEAERRARARNEKEAAPGGATS